MSYKLFTMVYIYEPHTQKTEKKIAAAFGGYALDSASINKIL